MPYKLTGRSLAAMIAIALMLISFLAIGYFVDFAELLAPDRIATHLDKAGPFAPVLLILAMALVVVISPLPSLPLDLAAGAAFGPLLGTTYAVIGAAIGATVSFLIARALGRDLLSRLLHTDVVFCEKCSDQHLFSLLVLVRLIPVFSFDIISYGAGLTNVSLRTFTLATLIGMIPPTFALTYLGSSLTAAHWPLTVLGLGMVAVFLIAPKLVMRYPNAWWARLFLAAGPQPAMATMDQSARPAEPAPEPIVPTPAAEPTRCCSGCGVQM